MLFKNYKEIIENGEGEKLKGIRKDILDILSSALESVDPYNSVKKIFNENKISIDNKVFDLTDFDNIYLVSFGKASIGMSKAVCDSTEVKKGIVVTNEVNKKLDFENIETITASHPIPDENSIAAAKKIIDLVKDCHSKDLLIVLISGGGSALLCKPKVSLKSMQKTTDLLLKSGADIKEINTIRKHLSEVKGGQLIKDVLCKTISLVISDIINDPLDFIASGPTYPDSTTYSNSKKILINYNIWSKIPNEVKAIINSGINKEIEETPDFDDPIFDNVSNFIVANNSLACKSAFEKAEELNYKSMLVTTSLEGEAREVSRFLVEKALGFKTYAEKMIFISGGETTVTITGDGQGGRNQEMVLASVDCISSENIVFSSFATDGVDGMSDAAGAIADKNSLKKAKKLNLDTKKYLKNNDSYNFFKKISDLFITSPTGTNVMDIQIIVKYK